jgi:hypothetical protein
MKDKMGTSLGLIPARANKEKFDNSLEEALSLLDGGSSTRDRPLEKGSPSQGDGN